MNAQELNAMEFGERGVLHIEDTIYVIRTDLQEWSVCDNGEEVAGCDLETTLRIIKENLDNEH